MYWDQRKNIVPPPDETLPLLCIFPSFSLLSHAVTDLKVLPECEFTAVYAQPRKVAHLKGFYQVHETNVYPKDESWFKHFKKADKGNTIIKKEVCTMYVGGWMEFG